MSGQVAILALEAEEENISEEKKLSLGQEVSCLHFYWHYARCRQCGYFIIEAQYGVRGGGTVPQNWDFGTMMGCIFDMTICLSSHCTHCTTLNL